MKTVLLGILLISAAGVLYMLELSQNGAPAPDHPRAPSAAVTQLPNTSTDLTPTISRFNNGSCTQSSDCVVSGCSGEVCGATSMTTTCEFDPAFPSVRTHSCECISGACQWQSL